MQAMSVLDLAKAAKLLTEVAAVNQEPLLASIDIVQAESAFLDNARSSVIVQAQVHFAAVKTIDWLPAS